MGKPTSETQTLFTASPLPILLLLICWALVGARGITFEHATLRTQDLTDLEFVQENSWYQGQSVYQKDNAVWLNPDPREVQSLKGSNLGRVIYKDPVRFINRNLSNQVASFSTNFTFQIITTAPYQECGSGMAFFISNSEKAPNNSDAGQLGLVDVNNKGAARFFAVEFDTHISPAYGDPSASHIGIDINSLKSINTTDTKNASTSPYYPELYLYSNYIFSTWIKYDAVAHLIKVWMTNSSASQRPSQPIMQASYDLSLVFEDFMYVGFTATNAPANDSMEGHVLYSWYFSNDNLSNPVTGNSSDGLSDRAVNTNSSFDVDTKKGSSSMAVVIGIALSMAVLLLVGIIVACICIRKRKRRKSTAEPVQDIEVHHDDSINPLGAMLRRFSYTELEIATNAFDQGNRIGAGGYSTVYKGTLPSSGMMIAVKKLREHLRREDDFITEINIITGIRHRNLLQLHGWCYERGEAMLVYKYMSKGSLESYLFGKKRGVLQNDTRFKVLVGVASALEYLHNGLPDCVLHRDVKAANVMLTDKWEPLLGDFGLARFITHDEAVTLTAAGTPGYVAPEVVFRRKADEKVDVYSFGVLALEVACGRPASSISKMNKEVRLVDWVRKMSKDNDQLMGVLDEDMKVESMSANEREKWRNVLVVGLMCCNELPEARPSMRQISQALQGDTLLLPMSYVGQQQSRRRGGSGSGSGRATTMMYSHIEAPFGCSDAPSRSSIGTMASYSSYSSSSANMSKTSLSAR
ncbi:hypothetical protein L7F22_015477 [Adiantum nelumboides]|nr:hypothetical protein [Adiantum nelumboides]